MVSDLADYIDCPLLSPTDLDAWNETLAQKIAQIKDEQSKAKDWPSSPRDQ